MKVRPLTITTAIADQGGGVRPSGPDQQRQNQRAVVIRRVACYAPTNSTVVHEIRRYAGGQEFFDDRGAILFGLRFAGFITLIQEICANPSVGFLPYARRDVELEIVRTLPAVTPGEPCSPTKTRRRKKSRKKN